jgi:hypothetical protein
MPIKIDGKVLRLRGGVELVLPPLSVRMVRKFTRDGRLAMVQSISTANMPTDEQWGAVVAIVTEALKVNEPAITEDEVEDLLDFSNLMPVLEALFSMSGFQKVKPGEAQSPSTGTTSSPTSAQ